MRKLGIFAAMLLLTCGISFAGDDKVTVRGCLMQMGEDFILTDASGTKYEIDEMNAQLKDHLGQVVEIEGEREGRSDDDKHEARKVDAKQIRSIAGDCSSFNVAHAGTGAASTTTTTTTTTTAGTVEADDDGDISGAEKANAAGSASQPEGSGVVTAGTTGPTTHTAGRVDPNTGATSTGTAGGTSVSPDATVAQSNPPDQKPFGQEQRTGEPATGTPEVTEGEARVDADVDASGAQVAGDRASAGKKREVTGCVSRAGDHFILTEVGTGATYRLDGEGDKLSAHNGHKVTLVGEAEQLGERSSSGAQFEFDVEEVRHIAPNCAAAGTSTTGHAGHHGSTTAGAASTTGANTAASGDISGSTSTATTAGTTSPSTTVSGDTSATAAARSTTSTTSGVASPTRADTGQTVTGTGAMAAPDPAMNPPAGSATASTRVESDQPMGKKRDVRGCVSQVGDQFVLTEEGTGATYRLDGEHDKLRKHVNQTVELKGEAEQLGETSGSGAQFEFDVEEVTFVSAGCSGTQAQPQGIERN